MSATIEKHEVRIEVEGARRAVYIGRTAISAIQKDAFDRAHDSIRVLHEEWNEIKFRDDFEALRGVRDALQSALDFVETLVYLAPVPDYEES